MNLLHRDVCVHKYTHNEELKPLKPLYLRMVVILHIRPNIQTYVHSFTDHMISRKIEQQLPVDRVLFVQTLYLRDSFRSSAGHPLREGND